MSKPTLLQNSFDRNLQTAPLIGKGFTSEVYAWGEGRVLKLFNRGRPTAKAEREYRVTRAVHAAGLPVPAACEVVEIDGRLGIIFERVDGVSMLRRVQAKPWTVFSAVRQLADLQAQIHRCASSVELPSQREWLASNIETSADLSAAEKQDAQAALADLSDGSAICHGDFHPDNVLCTADGPMIIDWDTATRGDPQGDVAVTLRLIRNAELPPWMPRYAHALFKCSRALLYRCYLKRSLELHGGTRQQIEVWDAPLAGRCIPSWDSVVTCEQHQQK